MNNRGVMTRLVKPLGSRHLPQKAWLYHVGLYLTVHIAGVRRSSSYAYCMETYRTLILSIWELFESPDLLRSQFVSLYIPVVTVWVSIAAPNCHGKSR